MSHGPGGTLQELSEEQCRDLLGEHVLGRLVWNGSAGIHVAPVNYALDGDRVVVRVSAASSVAREAEDSPVAFEVDHLDHETRTGWSVLVRGTARIDFHEHEEIPEVDVWPAGPRTLVLLVEIAQLTGREVTEP
ncbi:MAG: pyridoxamine 5'-phosphate oxidase [Nocardioides sp.]|nr:pyridoxamine 5'-phosphate oxidase [Nocardioides sp.]